MSQNLNNNISDLLKIAGSKIDQGYFNKDHLLSKEGIDLIINKILSQKNITNLEKAQSYYFLGNAYSDLYEINNINEYDLFEKINYEFPEYEKAIYYYRLTLSIKEIDGYNIKHECLINLANIYSHLGRFIKSLELYNIAIKEGTTNQLAYGNLGIALFYYGTYLYDQGHSFYFAYFSLLNFNKAFTFTTTDQNVRNKFNIYYKKLIDSNTDEIQFGDLNLHKNELGKSIQETNYRKWCLKHKLFLNDFNDLGEYEIGANDIIHLPNMITRVDEYNYFIDFFNQIKQEYVSARYFLYEGISGIGKTHFSDKESVLLNTLDYSRYSINVERIKVSYKNLYSIFDKIAFFLNKYFNLGRDDDKVNFGNVWYLNKNNQKIINPVILEKKNHLIRGLFLISKDLLFHKSGSLRDEEIEEITLFRESINPSARKLNIIRNHMEHKFIKVYDDFSFNNHNSKDKVSFPISETELIDYAIELTSLVRESLIILSLMVNIQEKRKDVGTLVMPIYMDTFHDKYKY